MLISLLISLLVLVVVLYIAFWLIGMMGLPEPARLTKSIHEQTFGKSSVPEAKPQEQETIAAPFSPLEQALDEFEALAQSEEAQMRTRRGWDKFEPLVKARERVLAAAHREYAQPDKQESASDFRETDIGLLRHLANELPRHTTIPYTDGITSFGAVSMLRSLADRIEGHMSAAQPGKGA